MFPDSQIAANFTCGERKTSYLCVFGIAEYFQKLLISEIKGPYTCTIMFDESLNKNTTKADGPCKMLDSMTL